MKEASTGLLAVVLPVIAFLVRVDQPGPRLRLEPIAQKTAVPGTTLATRTSLLDSHHASPLRQGPPPRMRQTGSWAKRRRRIRPLHATAPVS